MLRRTFLYLFAALLLFTFFTSCNKLSPEVDGTVKDFTGWMRGDDHFREWLKIRDRIIAVQYFFN